MPRRSTSKTPFSVTYGAEAVIPIEVGLSRMKVSDVSPWNNDACVAEQLDLLEERREMALIRLVDYQKKLT